MNLANIPLAAKVGAGAIAGLALLGGGAAVGAHLTGSVQASGATPVVVATPAPSASPARPAANAASQAARRAALESEAQVLGVSQKDLNADFKAGKTVQQLAAAKGLSADQFRTQFHQALQALLDKAVAAGTLTADQEQKALTRLDAAIPNWSQIGAVNKPSPTPTP
jgi:membrane-bound lytic murein transglycosylase B